MSKAIQGTAMIGGAVALGATAFFLAGSGVGIAALPFLTDAMYALAAGGIAMEAGAVASALTSQRGQNITTRQPAAQRQVIYGMQRVGGIIIYQSTTGGTHNQYNFVIVLAGHACGAIEALYLDGRRVWQNGGGTGYEVGPMGIGFGGEANSGTYTGPSGQQYYFGSSKGEASKVFCEPRYGTQASGDVIGSLTANDGTWAARGGKSPYVGGCTYVYLKLEYDTTQFPALPEARFTVYGKPVYDPRTGTTAWSANNALIINDILTNDPAFAGKIAVNQAQLIAAANVCDEQVYSQWAAAYENRYTAHIHYDAATPASDAIAQVLAAMAGRMSYINGEWYIWPAYWQGPSFSFDQSTVQGAVTWKPYRSIKDLFNRITGTYTAPNYPYSVAGNLYDSNGFDSSGNAQDNFQFGFQPTNYPQYACDPQHGYPADEYLNADSGCSAAWSSTTTYAVGDIVAYSTTIAGVEYAGVYRSLTAGNVGNTPGGASNANWVSAGVALPHELTLNACMSISQAQRVAKITLLRNRQQGSGSMSMLMASWQMQPLDVMQFTFPLHGWADKLLEMTNVKTAIVMDEGVAKVRATFGFQETAASVYEWDPAEEELSITDVSPVTAGYQQYVVQPPTDMALNSGAGTAVVSPTGTVTPQIEVTWDTPLDGAVVAIEIQYQPLAGATWTTAGQVSVLQNQAYISPVTAGAYYDVRIRSVRANGAVSVWVEIDDFQASLTLDSQTQDGVGQGSLIGEAYSTGNAAIICEPFTAQIGQLALNIFPAGPVTITNDGTIGGSGGLIQQQTFYWVYYVDPTSAGGNVTPIATTNKADFLGKLGYWLIDDIITPYAPSGGGTGTRYSPTTYDDRGTRTTGNPAGAYDGNLSTCATVSGMTTTTSTALGLCNFQGFASVVVAAGTLTVVASALCSPYASCTITVNIGGTVSTVEAFTATTAQATYTYALPANTDISTVTVTVSASPPVYVAIPGHPPTGHTGSCSCSVYEIYIQ